MALKLIFMGSPDFAVPTLAELVGAGHDIRAVYSQPAKPAGRGMAEMPTPVARAAGDFGLPVLTPRNFRNQDAIDQFAGFEADAAVVVAYGLILPQAVLDATRYGCFNLHASKLPRWRGAAPIQRAIMAGDGTTAASIMRMEAGLDTGPVCMEEAVAIGADMTAGDLHDELARAGAGLMLRAMSALALGQLDCETQAEEGVTYAAKIDKVEARVDWSRSAAEVHNHIRGLSPFPGAWTQMPDGSRLKILRSSLAEGKGEPGIILDNRLTIACGEGAVRLQQVQRAGARAMDSGTFLLGQKLVLGDRLE
ncbi:MAG: methionyl-tRNA formyltransferase [Rhodobiaceae bacterium]|nr:methionyl-tRNA formyltransferase [Rhodobiaceae bacterium]MCC0055114.1 methionyl-tRNA formyltransferase [Rhodobiaceae bacterium]